MKNFKLYPKLAIISISKNKKTYIPYILTCIGMVMMFYIVMFLSVNEEVMNMRGGRTMGQMLQFGSVIIAVFSVIFLFYTNSFIIRRRKKEFGLYNILGMDKKNLAQILVWETLFIAVISLAAGLLCGILFSKFAQMVMAAMLGTVAGFVFAVEPVALLSTAGLFCGIFVLILISSLFRIHISNPIDMVKSTSVGEKAPKANWLFALVGAVLLIISYYMAVTVDNPFSAVMLFFVAVIMVIFATYLLFISGSVTFCRLLQRRRKYYYKTNHFVSVSSMVYRMKHNGASLASICILATMVLVMMSSTLCLYIGKEENLRAIYPRNIVNNINVSVNADDIAALDDKSIYKPYENIIENVLAKTGAEPENRYSYSYVSIPAFHKDDTVYVDYRNAENLNTNSYSNVHDYYFMLISDYNALTGENLTLGNDEIMLCGSGNFSYNYYTIEFEHIGKFSIKKADINLEKTGIASRYAVDTVIVFINSYEEISGFFDWYTENYEGSSYRAYAKVLFDLDEDFQKIYEEEAYTGTMEYIDSCVENELGKDYDDESDEYYEARYRSGGMTISLLEDERAGWYADFSSLMFLGAMLSIVFIGASVLMIYYKQITEGYEDHDRFVILQKVGMTKGEVKKTINSQVLTVFFLPLIAAGIHLAAAFNIVFKLLQLFSLTNIGLFVIVNICCYLAFALIYILVYAITSRAYYNIVKA